MARRRPLQGAQAGRDRCSWSPWGAGADRGSSRQYSRDAAPEGDRVKVALKPGQAFLCHNWTIHRSGVNVTGTARRGFSCVAASRSAPVPPFFCSPYLFAPLQTPCSVNYIDARTRVLNPKPADSGDLGKPGEGFPLIFPATYSV